MSIIIYISYLMSIYYFYRSFSGPVWGKPFLRLNQNRNSVASPATELVPEILQMVDDRQIAFRPAVEISYLTEEQQYTLPNPINALMID